MYRMGNIFKHRLHSQRQVTRLPSSTKNPRACHRFLPMRAIRQFPAERLRMGLPDACLVHVEGLSFPSLWPTLVTNASVSQ